MKLELTQQDCANVKIALMAFAKQPNASEAEMIAALNLAQKFNWSDPSSPKNHSNLEGKVVEKME